MEYLLVLALHESDFLTKNMCPSTWPCCLELEAGHMHVLLRVVYLSRGRAES